MDRKRVLLNILTGIITKVIILFITIVLKRFLILDIGPSANGLLSLFASIISIITIIELGLGSAITYSLYKPIVAGDRNQISALFYKYRKYYKIIGILTLLVGIFIMPFLDFLIKDTPYKLIELISFFTIFTRGMFLPVDATTKNWIFLSISGLIGFFIGDIFLFQSYLEVGSRISMLIMAASPPITAILGYFVFGERLSIVNLFGMALTLTITSIVPVTIIPLSILVFKEKVKFKEIIGAMVTVVGVGVLFLF